MTSPHGGREEPRLRNGSVAGSGFAARHGPAQPAAASGYEGTFSVDDLAAVRRLAAGHGGQAGLGPAKLGDFVLAVNEAATNAVCHGCDRAGLRLWVAEDEVCCEVHGGQWISREQSSAVLDDTDSLRLWVMWQVCSDVALSHGPGGSTVLLSMAIH